MYYISNQQEGKESMVHDVYDFDQISTICINALWCRDIPKVIHRVKGWQNSVPDHRL